MSWSSASERSRRRPQLDNRQVFPAVKIRYFQRELLAQSERSHWRASSSLIGSLQPLIDFRWRPPPEGLVGPVGVMPSNERHELRPHRGKTEGHHDYPHRLGLQRQKEPLDTLQGSRARPPLRTAA